MHADSLTPQAQYNFLTTLKSEIHMQNGDGMQKNLKCMRCQWHRMHSACGVNDTACKILYRMRDRRTIRTALAAFKGNIYQTHVCSELSYPTTKKIYKLKGAT
jgi:hypothetical protein